MKYPRTWRRNAFAALGPLFCLVCVSHACGDDASSWITLWGQPELESGQVDVRRDETTFFAGPAAMLVDASQEATRG
ncbi:MAG: hypothetical protein JJ992_18320, partial [Planctomycetes bacterium]|nr:hypothetical protein [Planctomycetota bacterium]